MRCPISEDAHNPDGSPPSFVPAEIRAEWWERKAKELKAECHDWAEKCGRDAQRTPPKYSDLLCRMCGDHLESDYVDDIRRFQRALDAEHARSARLRAELQHIIDHEWTASPASSSAWKWINHFVDGARKALAEYEATRD